jgi:transcriptional regulator with XRE-family HTH domain
VEERTVGQLVGANVRAARIRRQMTQEELGAALEAFLGRSWSRQAVSIAENGDRAFVAEDLLALAGALETPVEDLLLPSRPTSMWETVVSLPATDLAFSDLLNMVYGWGAKGSETMVSAGRILLREQTEGLREAHKIATHAAALLEERLRLFDEMVAGNWYLAKEELMAGDWRPQQDDQAKGSE